MSATASIDTFIDALWLEEGLSRNTLAAYRRDLSLYGAWRANASAPRAGGRANGHGPRADSRHGHAPGAQAAPRWF